MALIRFHDDTTDSVSAEYGLQVYKVLNGKDEGTPELQEYCIRVKSVHLNWRKADDEWIKDNFRKFKDKAKDEWYVDNQGNPTRPQYDADWTLAKKWNLFSNTNPFEKEENTLMDIY
jgi:hypothetical protein